MRKLNTLMGVLAAGAVAFTAPVASAESDYPTKPVRVITCEAGGGSDNLTRLVTPGLSEELGQPFVVENRPCGLIPGQTLVASPADGYTLLVSGSPLWIAPLMAQSTRTLARPSNRAARDRGRRRRG